MIRQILDWAKGMRNRADTTPHEITAVDSVRFGADRTEVRNGLSENIGFRLKNADLLDFGSAGKNKGQSVNDSIDEMLESMTFE